MTSADNVLLTLTGNALPHTDSSFNQHRSKYSLLLAHLVPSQGGNTDFFNVRQAYADLPEEKKAQLRDLIIEHECVRAFSSVLAPRKRGNGR